METSLAMILPEAIKRRSTKLDSIAALLDALSPAATLRRGYSITRYNGHAVTSAESVPAGSEMETTVADGIIISIKQ